MAEENETVADIIAEISDYRDPVVRERRLDVRLKAAIARERGDSAKLREALCEILSYIESFHKYITPGKGKKLTALFAVADTIRGKTKAALAAPPRNCDVGVPEERIQRWSKFCKARSKKLPPIHGFEWEDYPYESEATK